MGTSQHTTSAIPVETYLRGCVGYPVTDEAIQNILVRRSIIPETTVTEITKKQLDLCTADVYMWCATAPSVSGTISDADAGWKHSEGGYQINSSDKSRFISMANSIYGVYGESVKSTIKMRPFGMRVWRR